MQLITDWWGVVIGAENEGDDKILKQLFERLPESASSCYETGEIELTEDDYESYPSQQDDFDKPVTSFLKIKR